MKVFKLRLNFVENCKQPKCLSEMQNIKESPCMVREIREIKGKTGLSLSRSKSTHFFSFSSDLQSIRLIVQNWIYSQRSVWKDNSVRALSTHCTLCVKGLILQQLRVAERLSGFRPWWRTRSTTHRLKLSADLDVHYSWLCKKCLLFLRFL